MFGLIFPYPVLLAAQETEENSTSSSQGEGTAAESVPNESATTQESSSGEVLGVGDDDGEGDPPESLLDSGDPVDPPTISNPNVFTSQSKPPTIDASGALIHSVQLDIPPGRNGLTPDLTLTYNSQRLEDGVVGYGWSLSIPYIERLNKTGIERLYTDNYFTSSMGGELVEAETSGEYHHRFEDGSFIKFTLAGNSWIAYDKKGTKYTFGATTTAQLYATTTPSNVSKWMLEEIRDSNNNYVTYEYRRDNDTNQIYPDKITYTGHDTSDGIFTIDFTRATRPDAVISYESGFRAETRDRISEIRASVNGEWVRKYTLSYTTGQNAYRSLLTSVQETGRDDGATELALPATSFEYSSTTPGYTAASNPITDTAARIVADSDGNGLPDLNVFYEDYPGSSLAKLIKKNNYPTFTDITGDAPPNYWADDITGWYSVYRYIERGTRFFDANGDGKPDVLRSVNNASGGGTREYHENRSDYSTYSWINASSLSSIPMFSYESGGNYTTSGLFGNINGDGLVDYVISLPTLGSNQDSDGTYMHVGTSSPRWSLLAGSYVPIADMPTEAASTTANELVDINGDGLDDWMTAGTSTIQFCLNTGSGWDSACSTSWNIATSSRQTGGWDRGIRFVDFNGDGLNDYVRSYSVASYSSATVANIEVGTHNYVYLNTGSGWATTTLQVSGNIFTGTPESSEWTGHITYNELVDWNGDGIPEQSAYTSTTTKPDLLKSITYPTHGNSEMNYAFSSQSGTNRGLAYPLLLVTSITNRDNIGGAETTTYTHEGGKMYLSNDMRDRHFAGFATTTKRDALGSVQTFYHQNDGANTSAGEQTDAFALIGKPYREDVLSLASTTLKKTFYEWEVSPFSVVSTTTPNTHSLDLEQSSSQYASISDGSQTGLDFADAMTFSTWVKFETDPAGSDIAYFAKRVGSGNQRSYLWYMNTASSITLEWQSNGLTGTGVSVTWDPTTGIWYHLAVTKSGTSVKFYVNGLQQGSTQTGSFSTIFNGSAPVEVGGWTDGGFYIDGLYDDIRAWSRELSGTEIFDLYTVPGTFNNGANLQGAWHFDDAYTDSSSNSNTLVAQNSPVFSSTVAHSNNATSTSANRWFSYITNEVVEDWEGGATHKDRATEFTYSTSTGNLTHMVERGEVTSASNGTYSDTGSDARFTTFTYSTTSATNLSLPTSKLIKNNASTTVQETLFYYDGQVFGSTTVGNLTKEQNWISGSTYASTTKTYTSYGLVATSTDPRGNTTGYLYDSFNLYPATTTNALSQVTGILYDYAKGAAKRVTDPNGLVKTSTFDPVGRVIEEKQPDLTSPSTLVTSKLYTYTDTFPTSVRTRSYLTSATTTDIYAYRDGLGRPMQDRVQAAGNNTYAIKEYVYGSAGQLSHESLPYFASSTARTSALATSSLLYIAYHYDALRRASSTVTSVGTTQYTYTPWKTRVTDAKGNQKDMLRDAYDNLSTVVEYNDTDIASTTYAYDALQNLTNITDALANVRSFTYDGLSRRTAAQDLHDAGDGTFGTWTYGYDLAGNVSSTTDPKAQVVNYTYDALNRATAEDYLGAGGTEVTYLYDFCTYGIGRICTASSTEAYTSTEYNSLGLASAERRVINGTAYASTTFAYDRLGNPTTITYPDGREVLYGYDTGGKIADIKTRVPASVTSDVLSKVEYAPHGLTSLRTYGNGVEIPFQYLESQLYRLQSIGITGTSSDTNTHSLDLETGSSQYASISDASQSGLDFSDPFTIASWVRLESFNTGQHQHIVSKREGAGSQRSYNFYLIDNSGTQTMNLDTQTDGLSAGCGVTVSWTPSTATWYHVAVVKNGTSVKFYVNGVQQGGTQTCGSATVFNGTAQFQIGAMTYASEYFDGLIDDVRVWSRALSDLEIAMLEDTPELFTNGSSIQGWWRLNNGYTDASGNGNTVTGNNSPVFSATVPYINESFSGGGIQNIQYTYDAVGNITTIKDNSGTMAAKIIGYTYDDLNRLVMASTTAATSTPYLEVYRYNMLGNLLYKGNNVGTSTLIASNTHSLDLEGSSSQYASIADGSQAGLDFADALTFSTWVKFETDPVGGDVAYIGKRLGSGNQRSYLLYQSGATTLTFESQTDGLAAGCAVSVTWNPTTATWYHVAVTKSGTSVSFYVNGSQQGSTQTCSNATIFNGTAPFQVGGWTDGGFYTDGILDDTRVWSRSLSSGEISSLYSTPTTFDNGANLQGAWALNNAYTDTSGNGNTLVGQGSPIFTSDTPYSGSSTSTTAAVDTYAYEETLYANPHAPTAYFTNGATSTLAYDANGNLTNYGTSTAYTYDYRNRMTATGIRGATTTYAYDHTTNRVRMTTPTATSHYVNKYFSKTGATSTAYIWHADTLVATIDANGTATTTYYVHPDHLGSTNVVTNQAGAVVQTLDYYPYGSIRINSGLSTSDRQFIGQRYDGSSDLNYLNARYYSSGRGQFISQDPVFWGTSQNLLNPQSLNSYSYANGNPINHSDPSGLAASNAQINQIKAQIIQVQINLIKYQLQKYASNVAQSGRQAATGAIDPIAGYQAAMNPNLPTYQRASAGAGTVIGIAGSIYTPAVRGATGLKVLKETLSKKGEVTSAFRLSADEALDLGEEYLGKNYTELGKPGSGVFRSSDSLRGFRIDEGSLLGRHGKIGPHVHLERYDSVLSKYPSTINHVPFYDAF